MSKPKDNSKPSKPGKKDDVTIRDIAKRNVERGETWIPRLIPRKETGK